MVLEARGSLQEPQKAKTFILVPQPVRKDSRFPFRRGDKLIVRIEPEENRLVILKAPPQPKAKAKATAKTPKRPKRVGGSSAESGRSRKRPLNHPRHSQP